MFKRVTVIELFFYSLMIAACVVGWLGVFDKAAYIMNMESLEEAMLAFVSIKGLSAIVLMLNKVPILGTLLVPTKEFLDQVSWVMLVSLMSLGLQKVILVALQSFVVNTILSFSVIAVIFTKFTTAVSEDWASKFLKFTVILFFIRFAIPLMTFTIASIESNTQQIQQEVSAQKMQELQEQLLQYDQVNQDKKSEKLKKDAEVKELEDSIATLKKTKKILEKEIDNIKSNDKNWVDKAKIWSEKDLSNEEKLQVAAKRKQITELEIQIKTLDKKADELDSFFDFANVSTQIKKTLAKIETTTSKIFDSLLTSSILFLFRNVVFPILFLWGLAKLINNAFSSNFNATKFITRDKEQKPLSN